MCYENHGSSIIIVIRTELRIFYQGVTLASFWPKKENVETLKTIVCMGGSYLVKKYVALRQNAFF